MRLRIFNGLSVADFLVSHDDEQQGESNSIVDQKRYLEEYAYSNGFSNIRHYLDDEYSGANFNRTGFRELLKTIDDGEVETVIVKDHFL